MKLLIVEDNASLGAMLADHFRERQVIVDIGTSGDEAIDLLARTSYDAMILDLGLPDIDGLALLGHLRVGRITAPPTLILTARDRVDDRISGLDAGADDYILKPFDVAELEARLRAVLRRPGLRWSDRRAYADLGLDIAERTLTAGGTAVELSPRETALLDMLLAASGRPVVRDALADRLFGADSTLSANALEAVVSRARRKLIELGSTASIETLRGVGYRLTAAADRASPLDDDA